MSNTTRRSGKDNGDETRAAAHAAFMADHAARRAEAETAIFRAIADVKHLWRSCGERHCRRNHACGGGPDFPCIRRLPKLNSTEAQRSAAAADFKRMIDARLRELETKGEGV